MEKVDRVIDDVKIRIKDKPGDNSEVAPVDLWLVILISLTIIHPSMLVRIVLL